MPENAPVGGMSATLMMPVVSGAGGLLVSITMGRRPLFAAAGLLFMVASVGVGLVMFMAQYNGPRRRVREQRERYLDYLDGLRGTLREVVAAQREAGAMRHPPPEALPDLARLPSRRWERRPSDPDFLRLRAGTGTAPLARPLTDRIDRDNPLTVYDPVCLDAADRLVEHYGRVAGEPLELALAEAGMVSIVAGRQAGRDLARALVAQLVATASPGDAGLAVVRAERLAVEWDWLKWLPHNTADGLLDGPLPARLVAAGTLGMAELLEGEMEERAVAWQRRRGRPPGPGTRRLVVVVDGEYQATLAGLDPVPPVPSAAVLGVHVIVLVTDRREEPDGVEVRVTVDDDGGLTLERLTHVPGELSGGTSGEAPDEPPPLPAPVTGVADRAGTALLTELARELAPLRASTDDGGDALHTTIGLADILGVPDPAVLDPARTWRPRPAGDVLRVPIGVGPDGRPVLLDLKESAFGGMGPHGLVVGATGSGKSEMLRTLVGALAIAHPPDRLALLLVDFKGGATFADLAGLPHSAGMITNLADDDALVDRFHEALYGELIRRQQLLKDLGALPNVHAYAELRDGGRTDLEPLPHLLVIIDEFSELLTAHPDFADLFLAVGRIGRSIGVHLLLATQRLEAGKIRGLESHLSYRIGLRTFSEGESREAIGVPDAYHLPPEPGSGILKVDTSVFERFKAAMVSGPYTPPRAGGGTELPVLPLLPGNGLGPLLRAGPVPAEEGAPPEAGAAGRSVLQVIVDRIADAGAPPARPVWVPPLPDALPLDAVGDEPGGDPDPEEIIAVLGRTDLPREQRQEPTRWDFAGGDGNVIVLGGPQTGKSVLLRTLAASLALRYPPGRVAIYCLDYGGGSLTPLERLPHVASVATRSDPERVERVLSDLTALLDERERLMRLHRLDSPAALRRARADGRLPSSVYGDVFLLVDGMAAAREASDDLDEKLAGLVTRGPALGLHTIVTAGAASQVRARTQAAFGGRIEFRLTDTFDSALGRKAAERLPRDVPGRVLLPGERFAQVALPRIDGGTGLDDLPAAEAELIDQVLARWSMPAVAAVRTLPVKVELAGLPGGGRPDRVTSPLLGISDRDLGPARLDLLADPHLVVFGDSRTGKSALLRTLLRQIAAVPYEEVGVVLLDPRRSHLGLIDTPHQLAYCTERVQAGQVLTEVAEQIRKRLPGPDVTPKQLRERSWWRGLEMFVVVDDLDLLTAAGSANPLTPLLEFIPQGADLGLHVVVARRTGGAARALYEPVLQALTEMSSPAMLFSGDRMEGRLANGVASRRLPEGRALLARRGVPPEQIQVAWTAPVTG
ncbi:type VII secretion protein EccCa [Actinomadura sp. LD22]|uniref:Type VII secretion protein EccCa n=1 Tax=Actinomadura physcomitrii TaxID=2650748 RepID=A0A6I4MJW8_9ACTN|nr:type VII secretion protein EccCa [Actinomadura physcomitrii]